jgi:hypothetical protein
MQTQSTFPDISTLIKIINRLGDYPSAAPKTTTQKIVAKPVIDTSEIEKAQINADAELRIEVIKELVASGIALHVATNRTNTTAKMLSEAKALDLI